MAYAMVNTPTHAQIPQHIIDFATLNVGWQNAGVNRIAVDGADAGISFELESVVSAVPYPQRQVVRIMDGEDVKLTANSCAPYINRVTQSPGRLHLFGAITPTPFIAAVIEYAPGFFRQLYLGYMEKIGDYTGGEVISGNTYYVGNAANLYDRNEHQYLFGGLQGAQTASQAGGVRLVHDDIGGEVYAPLLVANARLPYFNTDVPENAVLGGFKDNFNDQAIARGSSTFAAVQLTVPVNMLLSRPASRFSPIGHPAGVRMVNLTNVDVGAPVTVGGKVWRCFPAFRRGLEMAANGTAWDDMPDETSYIVGYAFLEG